MKALAGITLCMWVQLNIRH